LVANKLVEVVLVPEAFSHEIFVKNAGAVDDTVNPDTTRFVSVAFVAVRSLVDTDEAVRLFVVRFVVVTSVNRALPPFSVVLLSVWIVADVAIKSPIVLVVKEALAANKFVVVTLEATRLPK